jgi:hypothetical protein
MAAGILAVCAGVVVVEKFKPGADAPAVLAAVKEM